MSLDSPSACLTTRGRCPVWLLASTVKGVFPDNPYIVRKLQGLQWYPSDPKLGENIKSIGSNSGTFFYWNEGHDGKMEEIKMEL